MAKIAIRTDGGKAVGLGHLMRCMALAGAFRRQNHEVCFFSRLSDGMEKIRQNGFEAVDLGLVAKDESVVEIPIIARLLREKEIDILVVDSYAFGPEYFIALQNKDILVAYVDDENRFPVAADVIINGNFTAPHLKYKKQMPEQLLLLGMEYNLLREEFRDSFYLRNESTVRKIMLTTGGTDPYNLTEFIASAILGHPDFQGVHLNILVGNCFSNRLVLENLRRKENRISLFSSDKDNCTDIIEHSEIKALMLNVDMAISSGGSTLYELLSCGTPTMAFVMAQNQNTLVEKMAESGYVVSIGWYNEWKSQQLLAEMVAGIAFDVEKREKLSYRGKGFTDGLGTVRIVKALQGALLRKRS